MINSNENDDDDSDEDLPFADKKKDDIGDAGLKN